MTATRNGEGTFPIVTVKVNGVTCRALVDSGAGSSYASTKLVSLLNQEPVDVKTRRIEMLMSTKLDRLETYQTVVESVDGEFNMRVDLIKVNKSELMSIENPHYKTLIDTYPHLEGVYIHDDDMKSQLPVRVVLGGGEYARIKTECRPRVGKEGEPIAEQTKLGWFIMSPGKEFDHHHMLLTQTTHHDYEELCRLDVLGLADTAEHDQGSVYNEFKEQLVRSPEGWYETGLPWRGNHGPLPSNKEGSLRRLNNLVKRLSRDGLTEEYNQIIEEQKSQGIVELATDPPVGQEFFLPHKPVIRTSAQSTKTRVVYDASARASPNAPSLNECLYPGPPLQNKLWDVLVRHRSFPVALCGDIEKAFLQIRIKLEERDALRFHWRRDEHSETLVYRFTRALFGLTSSPFLLGGVIEQHLETWESKIPEIVAELRRCMYVDDLLSGAQTVEQAKEKKNRSIEVFNDAKFTLHKWNSNVVELEDGGATDESDSEATLAKEQLGTKPSESKILGLPWNKDGDLLSVVFPTGEASPTKREVLSKLAQVYDPLGFVAPITLQGKQIYRDICSEKLLWDAKLSKSLGDRWSSWKGNLPQEVIVPRSIVGHQEPVLSLELHAFGDASTKGVGAAVYSVVHQPSGITQRLVTAKSRLAKQGLTVPRLELISAHMAANLLVNVRNALDYLPTPEVYAWLDSTVALYWILGNGQYKQFVSNRVSKIQQHPEIQWRHVPTSENPADLASRGGSLTSLWWNGPVWLADRNRWPENLVTSPTVTSEAEAKVVREIVAITQDQPCSDEFEPVLEKHTLQKALRVAAWVSRFINNCKQAEKKIGPLSVKEIEEAKGCWIQRVQKVSQINPIFEQHRRELNLQLNDQGFIECRGRIEGSYPIYLPTDALFTRKLVEKIHRETLHGGVGLTMAAIRENYWIPKLRSVVKKVRKECFGCKRYQATAVNSPPPGTLPNDRVSGESAFEFIGVDFAGPIRYKRGSDREGKAYLALFSCSLIRAVHLELLPNLETSTFIPCLKRFIARRGRPKRIYSDNGGTFIKAANWIRTLRKDEKLQGYLQDHEIQWQFNLSRAPWWGGQFERLIGVVKQAMYKAIGGANLNWNELSEVILDVEVQINRRPLSYVEDDIQLPVLTPSSFLFQRSNLIPDQEPWREDDKNLRKRAKYLKSCKDSLWKRWSREYVNALRERHNLNHERKRFHVNVGDVVIIKSDEKNRGKWPLGVVQEVYPGRDGVVRAVQVKTANGHLERAIQHLYPLELSCDQEPTTKINELNPDARPFRPKRAAAQNAAEKIKVLAEMED